MIHTLLFDLDNTLVLFDEKVFFKQYLTRLFPYYQDLATPELLQKQLMLSTQKMLNNSGEMLNATFFLKDFSLGLNQPEESLWNRFVQFYKSEFDALRNIASPIAGVNDMIQKLDEQGYQLVVASNPVWPLLVQELRLDWADLNPQHFEHITHIENTRFCKPNVEYYAEICDSLNIDPQTCMMIGNDPVNDMAAGKIGIKTYLTTDWLQQDHASLTLSDRIRRQHDHGQIQKPDFEGCILNVPNILSELN